MSKHPPIELVMQHDPEFDPPIELSAEEYREPMLITRERDLQRLVVDMASALGWTHYATVYSVGADPGYPDLTLVHPEYGVIWLELKTDRGRVSEAQREWLTRLLDAGQRAWLVYPGDTEEGGWLERVLKGEVVHP
jgi:hypothetical protein